MAAAERRKSLIASSVLVLDNTRNLHTPMEPSLTKCKRMTLRMSASLPKLPRLGLRLHDLMRLR